jgi:hypothetical protein
MVVRYRLMFSDFEHCEVFDDLVRAWSGSRGGVLWI